MNSSGHSFGENFVPLLRMKGDAIQGNDKQLAMNQPEVATVLL
jgi:hypothetical protein